MTENAIRAIKTRGGSVKSRYIKTRYKYRTLKYKHQDITCKTYNIKHIMSNNQDLNINYLTNCFISNYLIPN